MQHNFGRGFGVRRPPVAGSPVLSRMHEQLNVFRQELGHVANDVTAQEIQQRAALRRTEPTQMGVALETKWKTFQPSGFSQPRQSRTTKFLLHMQQESGRA
jgi:hypothetical protein